MSLIGTTVNYNEDGTANGVPTYLFDQAETYKKDPRDAGLEWFAHARLGLSIHYGLTTLMGAPEDPAEHEEFKLEEYRLLPKKFSCANFNAMDIAELVIAAGGRYVTMPAKLKDGFCLFNAPDSEYTSVKSPACRDLIGEMASVCEYHGLGLCISYPLSRDWLNDLEYSSGESAARHDCRCGHRHDHGAAEQEHCCCGHHHPEQTVEIDGKDKPEEAGKAGRIPGTSEDCCEQYLKNDLPDEEAFSPALKKVLEDIRCLLSQYGPVAALKIEGYDQVAKSPELQNAFKIIARQASLLQPQILVSLQQGLTGEETFYSVDHSIPAENSPDDVQGLVFKDASKPLELRFAMSPSSFSYSAGLAGKHLTSEAAWKLLRKTLRQQSNLLLHTCLMPDGSLDLEDIQTLLDLGKKIETQGYPC